MSRRVLGLSYVRLEERVKAGRLVGSWLLADTGTGDRHRVQRGSLEPWDWLLMAAEHAAVKLDR